MPPQVSQGNLARHPDQLSKIPNASSNSLTTFPNVLNKYASYTYNIALQASTVANYNLLIESQRYTASMWTTIVHSGGVGQQRAHRPVAPPAGYDPTGRNANVNINVSTVDSSQVTMQPAGSKTYFNSDLYIDHLSIDSVLTNTATSRGANETTINFTIVEPYGMSFLDDLFDFATEPAGLGEASYTAIPYLLVIKFLGYTDDGIATEETGAVKYIPIKILDMKIKLSESGATYEVSAVLNNDQANGLAYGLVQSQTEISDSNLNSMFGEFTDSLNKSQQAMTDSGVQQFTDIYKIIVVSQTSSDFGLIDIGVNKITAPGDNVPGNTPMSTPQSSANTLDSATNDVAAKAASIGRYASNSPITAAQQQYGSVIQFNSNNISIPAGKSILDAINAMIISSEYITAQVSEYQQKVQKVAQLIYAAEKDWLAAVNDYNAAADKYNNDYFNQSDGDSSQSKNAAAAYSTVQQLNKVQAVKKSQAMQSANAVWVQYRSTLQYPLKWFKVSPEVTFGNFDVKRNTYQKTIKYYVTPYLVYGSTSSNAPNAVPTNSVVKTYDYLFTGNNTEILRFDIEFSTAFQTLQQNNTATKAMATGSKQPALAQAQLIGSAGLTLVPAPNPMNQGQSIVTVCDNADNPAGTGPMTLEKCAAGDITATIYSVADLLSINMTIIGDPDYIHQDSMWLRPQPEMQSYRNGAILGSTAQSGHGILFDNGEVYFQLNFKLPQDYNMSSGKMELADTISTSAKRRRGIFQGYYRVMTVNSKFSEGKFTQDISANKIYPDNNSTDAPIAVGT